MMTPPDQLLFPMVLIWLAVATIGAFVQSLAFKVSGFFSFGNRLRYHRPLGEKEIKRPNNGPWTQTRDDGRRSSLSTPSVAHDAFNFIDPWGNPFGEAPHTRYQELFTNFLFPNAKQLMAFFGFQNDNVYGQIEHVLMLIVNSRRPQLVRNKRGDLESPVATVHSRVFANYKQWCK